MTMVVPKDKGEYIPGVLSGMHFSTIFLNLLISPENTQNRTIKNFLKILAETMKKLMVTDLKFVKYSGNVHKKIKKINHTIKFFTF